MVSKQEYTGSQIINYRFFNKFIKNKLPVTEKFYDEILTLPLHCNLSIEQQKKVIKSIKKFFRD